MQAAHYFRYHGLGNDYLVIDPAFYAIPMTRKNIQMLCHRNFGIGSDGILYGPLKDLLGKNEAISYFQIWNPDGSEAEKSGNGIRIFAQYLLDQGYTKESEFSLETLGGIVRVKVIDPENHVLQVDMGAVTMHAEDLPIDVEKLSAYHVNSAGEVAGSILAAGKRNFNITCVSVGNPHCVVIDMEGQGEISAAEARIYGPLIEEHPAFSNRTNVQFLKVLDRNSIQIEIWERGAGYTLASGSSSCAAAVAAWRNKLIKSPVRVLMPGGECTVTISPIDNSNNFDNNSELCPDKPNRQKQRKVKQNQWKYPCANLAMTGPVSGVCYGHILPDLQRQLES